jgi:hypothetical protein
MKRVPRADVALSVPWSAITGRPAPEEPVQQVTIIERVGDAQAASSEDAPETTLQWHFYWDPGTIRPLETVTHQETVLTARPGQPVALGSPYALEFAQMSAQVVDWQTVQVSVTNNSLDAVTPGGGGWRLILWL